MSNTAVFPGSFSPFTIGHKAMLHGCVVADNSLIGMGATILNGARIEKNCLV